MIKLGQGLENFLNEKKFLLEESKLKGRILIFTSDYLKLRISMDYNGLISISIKRNKSEFDWVQFSLLRSYLLKNNDYLEISIFEAEASFLISRFDDILNALNDNSYNATIAALDLMAANRARVRLGLS